MINQLIHARLVYKVPSACSKAKRHITLCNDAITSILDEKNNLADVGAKGGQYGYGLILEIALKSVKYDEFGKSFMAMISR